MNNHELNRERRKQQALERLGKNKPQCVLCGFDNPLALELHHIAGRAYDAETVPVCRNCHRLLSDAQKDQPPSGALPTSDLKCIAHFIAGLALLLQRLAKRLLEISKRLFAMDEQSQFHGAEAQS